MELKWELSGNFQSAPKALKRHQSQSHKQTYFRSEMVAKWSLLSRPLLFPLQHPAPVDVVEILWKETAVGGILLWQTINVVVIVWMIS